MTIKVLALASGVTGLADHRVLNGAMLTSDGTLAVRGGVLPGAGSGNLSTVSAMVARVAPVKVVIPNGVSSALGPYLLVSDANVDITFDSGEAAVPRVDRIIARAYDDVNDASGSTTGSIYYLKGTAGGSATALPTNSILLYEMTIPAGASAGGGGVNFANAVDQRIYTAAQGGIFPVASNTAMAAIGNPYEGMSVYRTDLDVLYVYDGSSWRARGQANVSSSANLTTINNAYDGMLAVTRDTDTVYVYNGSAWVPLATGVGGANGVPLCKVYDSSGQSLANNTTTAISMESETVDTHGFHSTSVNTSRITPTVAGWYRISGTVIIPSRGGGYRFIGAVIGKNGAEVAPWSRHFYKASSAIFGDGGSCSIGVTTVEQANGSTDYFELLGNQSNDSSAAVTLPVSGSFTSTLECEYIRPL